MSAVGRRRGTAADLFNPPPRAQGRRVGKHQQLAGQAPLLSQLVSRAVGELPHGPTGGGSSLIASPNDRVQAISFLGAGASSRSMCCVLCNSRTVRDN